MCPDLLSIIWVSLDYDIHPEILESEMRRLNPVFSLILLLAATALVGRTQTSQVEANKAVVRHAFEALEKGDIATLNALFDPQGPWHTPKGTTIPQGGPFSDLKSSCPMCAALDGRKITIDVMLAEGDLVAVRSIWSGKYTGNYRGIQMSGKDVSIIYVNIYRVVDGRIRENWADTDRLTLAEQLGMKLAPPDAAK
jgi:ketosteroid isomerase-like protein